MKIYQTHNCQKHHRTNLTFARCVFKRAEWVHGSDNGEYATLAHCRVLTVELHDTLAKAETAKQLIDSSACGGRCHKLHEIVRLVR